MKFLVALAVAAGVLLLVVGLFSYLVLPGLIESRLATSLQEGASSRRSLWSMSPRSSHPGSC